MKKPSKAKLRKAHKRVSKKKPLIFKQETLGYINPPYQFKPITKEEEEIFKKIPKNMVHFEEWAGLSLAAKAVFPILLCDSNKKGLTYPSERRISVLSGRIIPVVRQGIEDLLDYSADFLGLTIDKSNSNKTGKVNHYNIQLWDKTYGEWFPFFKVILKGGHWSRLTPSAQALYVAMMANASYNWKAHKVILDYEEEEYDPDLDKGDYYADDEQMMRTRKYDFLNGVDKKALARAAGISERAVFDATKCLVKNHLLDKYKTNNRNIPFYVVYRIPKNYFDESVLRKMNEKTNNRYK